MNKNTDDPPFYLVWNPQRGLPAFQHPTMQEAEEEAKRLARDNPGENFFVLAPMHRFKKNDLEHEQYDVDLIPF